MIPDSSPNSRTRSSPGATVTFPNPLPETAAATRSLPWAEPTAAGCEPSPPPSAAEEATSTEPALVAVQDVVDSFASSMRAAMRESEAQTAVMVSEALEATRAEFSRRQSQAVSDAVALCRINMEADLMRAVAASEVRCAESLGRALERIDGLRESVADNEAKFEETHRELRNSIAAAEERAAAALAGQRTDIEEHIEVQISITLDRCETKVVEHISRYDENWVAVRNSQETMDGELNDLGKKYAEVNQDVSAMGKAQAALQKMQEEAQEAQDELRALLETLQRQQAGADAATSKLETGVASIEKTVAGMKQAQEDLAKQHASFESELGEYEVSLATMQDEGDEEQGRVQKTLDAVWTRLDHLHDAIDVVDSSVTDIDSTLSKHDARLGGIENSAQSLERAQASTRSKLAEVESRIGRVQTGVHTVQKAQQASDAKAGSVAAELDKWAAKTSLQCFKAFADEAELRKDLRNTQATIDEHATLLADLRSDVESERSRLSAVTVKTVGMAMALAENDGLEGVGKHHYAAIREWLDQYLRNPHMEADHRSSAAQ